MKYRVQPPTDAERAHTELRKIVDTHCGARNRYRFTCALAAQLHRMKLRPSTLLTSEGFDAVTAIAVLIDDAQCAVYADRQDMLPKVWLSAIQAVSQPPPFTDQPSRFAQRGHFTNTIKVKRTD